MRGDAARAFLAVLVADRRHATAVPRPQPQVSPLTAATRPPLSHSSPYVSEQCQPSAPAHDTLGVPGEKESFPPKVNTHGCEWRLWRVWGDLDDEM